MQLIDMDTHGSQSIRINCHTGNGTLILCVYWGILIIPYLKIPGLDIITLTQTEEVTLYVMRLFIVIVYWGLLAHVYCLVT